VEVSSTRITYGSEVGIICSVRSSGLLTFTWHDLSHGIISVDIVSSSEKGTKSVISRPVYKKSTFQCVVHENGLATTSRAIIIGSKKWVILLSISSV